MMGTVRRRWWDGSRPGWRDEVDRDVSHNVLPGLTGAPISLNQCPLALEKGPGGPLLSPVLPLVCRNVRRVESGPG